MFALPCLEQRSTGALPLYFAYKTTPKSLFHLKIPQKVFHSLSIISTGPSRIVTVGLARMHELEIVWRGSVYCSLIAIATTLTELLLKSLGCKT